MYVLMIDRCQAIVKNLANEFHIWIRATESSRHTSCRSWLFHHRFESDVTSISITQDTFTEGINALLDNVNHFDCSFAVHIHIHRISRTKFFSQHACESKLSGISKLYEYELSKIYTHTLHRYNYNLKYKYMHTIYVYTSVHI